MSENKSCPFCGNEKIEALHMGHGGVSAYCYECEAEGPPRNTEAEAMEAWNRRTPASQAQRVQWENFPAYLIDHCEGDTITEEGLQRALSAMLGNPQYSTSGITQEKQG